MINETANKAVAQAIFTTPKDAVKLKDSAFNLPCFVVENTLKFDDEKKLRQMIYAVLD